MSPSATFVDVNRVRDLPDPSEKITVLGIFSEDRLYRARFTERRISQPFDRQAKYAEVRCEVLSSSQATLVQTKKDSGT